MCQTGTDLIGCGIVEDLASRDCHKEEDLQAKFALCWTHRMEEWDNGGLGVVGSEVGDLFECAMDTIEQQIDLGGIVFEVKCLSAENKHTNGRTGEVLHPDHCA